MDRLGGSTLEAASDRMRVIEPCECLGLGVRVWFVVRQVRTRSVTEGGLL